MILLNRASMSGRVKGSTRAFVAAPNAQIDHGGTVAFYRPSTDSIQLPPREAFIGSPTSSPAESYYSTLLNQCRTGRPLPPGRFRSIWASTLETARTLWMVRILPPCSAQARKIDSKTRS